MLAKIAGTVAQQLNQAALAEPVNAKVSYNPAFKLEQMNELKVTVVPRSVEYFREGRGLLKTVSKIDIAVQKRLKQKQIEQADELVCLCEAISSFFQKKKITESAISSNVAYSPVFVPEHMREFSQFTGVITLTITAINQET